MCKDGKDVIALRWEVLSHAMKCVLGNGVLQVAKGNDVEVGISKRQRMEEGLDGVKEASWSVGSDTSMCGVQEWSTAWAYAGSGFVDAGFGGGRRR